MEKALEITLMDYHFGRNPTWPFAHIMHCLDSLMDDVICHADDTPRYTTSSDRPESGMGQLRQCRDWDKLAAWAAKYSGCWEYIGPSADEESELNRWMRCPPDSPYFSTMQTYIAGQEADNEI